MHEPAQLQDQGCNFSKILFARIRLWDNFSLYKGYSLCAMRMLQFVIRFYLLAFLKTSELWNVEYFNISQSVAGAAKQRQAADGV